MNTWVTDGKNKCSVERYGSEEAARKALASLENCSGCIDCKDCSDCKDCNRCNVCRDCNGCRDCIDCIDCRGCSDCNGCSGCSGCNYCSYCIDCRDCNYCKDCKDCSGCNRCRDYNDVKKTAIKIPKLADIHKVIYAAVSQAGALDMSAWHTCETTHCRAGWVVNLAGEPGSRLEKHLGTALAAKLIYRESGAPIHWDRFFDSDSDAMADMKRLAEDPKKIKIDLVFDFKGIWMVRRDSDRKIAIAVDSGVSFGTESNRAVAIDSEEYWFYTAHGAWHQLGLQCDIPGCSYAEALNR